MSYQVTEQIYAHSGAREAHRLVLLALGWHARKEDAVAWASRPQLAARAKLSETQVRRSLRWLERIGEVRVLSPGRGRGHRAIYQVTVGTYAAVRPGPLPVWKKGASATVKGGIADGKKGASPTAPCREREPSVEMTRTGDSAPGQPEGPAPAAEYQGPGSPAWEAMKARLRRQA